MSAMGPKNIASTMGSSLREFKETFVKAKTNEDKIAETIAAAKLAPDARIGLAVTVKYNGTPETNNGFIVGATVTYRDRREIRMSYHASDSNIFDLYIQGLNTLFDMTDTNDSLVFISGVDSKDFVNAVGAVIPGTNVSLKSMDHINYVNSFGYFLNNFTERWFVSPQSDYFFDARDTDSHGFVKVDNLPTNSQAFTDYVNDNWALMVSRYEMGEGVVINVHVHVNGENITRTIYTDIKKKSAGEEAYMKWYDKGMEVIGDILGDNQARFVAIAGFFYKSYSRNHYRYWDAHNAVILYLNQSLRDKVKFSFGGRSIINWFFEEENTEDLKEIARRDKRRNEARDKNMVSTGKWVAVNTRVNGDTRNTIIVSYNNGDVAYRRMKTPNTPRENGTLANSVRMHIRFDCGLSKDAQGVMFIAGPYSVDIDGNLCDTAPSNFDVRVLNTENFNNYIVGSVKDLSIRDALRPIARKRVPGDKRENRQTLVLDAYTDGSGCENQGYYDMYEHRNRRGYGHGVIIRDDHGENVDLISMWVPTEGRLFSNYFEFDGILRTITRCYEIFKASSEKKCHVNIYCDNIKAVHNLDNMLHHNNHEVVEETMGDKLQIAEDTWMRDKNFSVSGFWVRGHNGNPNNEIADELAGIARRRGSGKMDTNMHKLQLRSIVGDYHRKNSVAQLTVNKKPTNKKNMVTM